MTSGVRASMNNRSTLMERSVPGRRGTALPDIDVPVQPMPDETLLRGDLKFPEITEPEVVRYFTLLSRLNYSIDTNFYPLGSCTMKYNPKLHDEMAFMPGFAGIHPLQPQSDVQGALKLLHRLQTYLAEITGMKAVSLASLAGAQGELSGMLMIRAYHLERGDTGRTRVAIPDSAHGTNPASAAMAGFEVVTVKSDDDGNMDLESLKAVADHTLAGVMITQPNTLGLFDTNILDLCDAVHSAGGLVYGDGANMNALLGRVKLAEMGFDVAHLNLHKTFTTPHGGGGPGAGPVCANETLAPYLPSPVSLPVQRGGGEVYELTAPEKTIGKVCGFHGNFGVLVRAYAYIRTMGEPGLREASGNAVLNANYVLKRLEDIYDLPYKRTCMHEVVFSPRTQKARGVRGLDIAKRLLDYGFHAPTMYFPLIVDDALMIEPTETESKETVDAFIDAMRSIDREISEDPEMVKGAPHLTPMARLDETRAARNPVLRG